MSSRVSNASNLRGLNKRLQGAARVTAIRVTQKAAARLTSVIGADFDSGRTAYGAARPLGVNGNALTLRQTGKTRGFMRFLSDGSTKLTAFLATRYARYLIGKYAILPNGNAIMPAKWREELKQIAAAEADSSARQALEGL